MNFFPPQAKPRDVVGGLRARSKRGAIAQTWWSERFIQVLESIVVGGRLTRGKNYARRGQVIDLDVRPGSATARVQGSRAKPYRVRLGVTAFGKAEWAQVEQALASRAWYMAKLLAGEMPDDIEDVFTSVGLSLFPPSERDLSMDCSCPDWSVPCKHLAAVCYLLAESFDDDPFAILGWRGREKQDLLDNLRALRGSAGPAADQSARRSSAPPLASCLDSYFALQAKPATTRPPATTQPGALLDQLPPVDITVRGKPLVDLLRPAYQHPGVGSGTSVGNEVR